MSKIDKLSIQGIRSFSPASRETIQFNTPLTLIVGYNGSGKTTIIECLKYATTGELPPNSKGGAFIHDPDLAQSKEILAQVKLSFKSANGAKYVVNRNLQLTVKKATRSMKTLEGSLLVLNNGERSVVSTRVAQLDEAIPSYLGVSPAVLDSVIFCHQDESLWPLSEPSALKKRFDEIFEAQKYTKAIDNLKTLRKKKGEDLRILKQREENDKVNKERGEKAEKESREIQALIEEDRAKCKRITAEMQETKDRIRKLREQSSAFLTLIYDLRDKRNQLKFREATTIELKDILDELPDDDATLEADLANYEERMRRLEQEADANRAQCSKLQADLAAARRDHSAKLAEQGKHQSDKEKYERQLQARSQLIQIAAQEHGFIGYDDDHLSESQVLSFTDRIQRLLADKKKDLERVQNHVSQEVEKARSAIGDLERKQSNLDHDKHTAKQRIDNIDRQSLNLNNRVRNLDYEESSLVMLEGQSHDAQERLEKARAHLAETDYDTRIKHEKNVQSDLSFESMKLNRELVECSRLAQDRAQLTFHKDQMAKRKLTLDSLKTTWKDKLDNFLQAEWTPENLDSLYQTAVAKQEARVRDAKAKRDQVLGNQTKLDVRLKAARSSLGSTVAEAEKCEKKVASYLKSINEESLGANDFDGELSHYEEKVEDCKAEIGLWDALAKYYTQCHKYLNTKNSCKLCERPFDTSQGAFRARMEKKIREKLNPKEKEESEGELAETVRILEELKSLRTDYETFKRLQNEIPSLKSQVSMLEAEYEQLETAVMDVKTSLVGDDEHLGSIKTLGKTVTTFAQTLKEIAESESSINRIESQQSASSDASKTAEEINTLLSECDAKIRAAKAKEDDLLSEKQRYRDQLNTCEMELKDIQGKLSQAKMQLEMKLDLQKQIKSLKDDHTQQREAISKADQELEVVSAQLLEAKSFLEEILRDGKLKEKAIIDERDVVMASINELKPIENDIQAYLDARGPANLQMNQKLIASLEQRISTLDEEIAQLTAKGNALTTEIDNGDRQKKNISDNLNYRKNLHLLEVLEEEIRELEECHATEDHRELEDEANALESHNSKLLAERGSVMGMMKSRDDQLRKLIEVWDMEYKDAAHKYREAHIKVETTKAAIEDMGRYSDALDKAIMQYHAMKMRQVNETAIDLWKSTYKGDDIDYIMIRSDAESATGRRNYNYRVVMSKQGTEMDMRGRCSAGQKVLASIIIRLALAESFGVNCGIIALDEPTTNLDTDNIKALAHSLHDLIQQRQAQSNFQLIIITHDEEFLRGMRCGDFCDVFYRVKRDDRSNSVIMRESITNVM
ncbi:DNA repair protein RAD50 [Ceratocystis fimbriata CBS 114723]|uniref:DNA repair protein RAD50 n=1 Tax=Ceratocystis fimbriata CBS 114723 TaxID=1035309 RepID=A0A2C5X9G6_9PEZI|nr:DNA repair protein RAD50 [Ceratocystis fimbriata CBS 114723]